MCGESMKMMKVCGNMLSEVRLEKNWGTSVNERVIYKNTSFLRKFGKFPVLSKFSLCCTQIPCVFPVRKK